MSEGDKIVIITPNGDSTTLYSNNVPSVGATITIPLTIYKAKVASVEYVYSVYGCWDYIEVTLGLNQ